MNCCFEKTSWFFSPLVSEPSGFWVKHRKNTLMGAECCVPDSKGFYSCFRAGGKGLCPGAGCCSPGQCHEWSCQLALRIWVIKLNFLYFLHQDVISGLME